MPKSRVCCRERISGLTLGIRFEADLFALGHQSFQGFSGLESLPGRRKSTFPPAALTLAFKAFPNCNALIEEFNKTLRIEIHIGEGGKKRLHGEYVDLADR